MNFALLRNSLGVPVILVRSKGRALLQRSCSRLASVPPPNSRGSQITRQWLDLALGKVHHRSLTGTGHITRHSKRCPRRIEGARALLTLCSLGPFGPLTSTTPSAVSQDCSRNLYPQDYPSLTHLSSSTMQSQPADASRLRSAPTAALGRLRFVCLLPDITEPNG